MILCNGKKLRITAGGIACLVILSFFFCQRNRLLMRFRAAGSSHRLSGVPLPAKNQIVSTIAKNSCRPSLNSLSALSFFPDFYSIAARRSLCTTFVTNYCGQHQRCLVHGRRISKYKYICFCYPSSMDRCSASARSLRFLLWWCISTAAWRLLVQTCCQKSEKRQQTTQTKLGWQICKGRQR